MKKVVLFLLLCGVTIMSDAKAKWKLETPLIPRSVLFGLEDPSAKASMCISPEGDYLLYCTPVDKIYNIFVCVKDDNGKFDLKKSIQITYETKQHIKAAGWMYTNGHILYSQDKDGDENTHLYLLDLHNQESIDLTPFDGVKVFGSELDRRYPNKILITMNKDNPQGGDLYTMDISKDLTDMTKLTSNPGNVLEYITDDDWNIRGIMQTTMEATTQIHLRNSDDEPFEQFIEWDMEDSDTSYFLDFCNNNKSIYIVDAKDSNTAKLKKINLETKEEEIIAHDPNYEMGSVFIHPKTKEIISYNIAKDRSKPTILDKSFESDFELMDEIEEGDLSIASMDKDMNTWICAFTYDDRVHNYYLFDRTTKEHYLLGKSSTKYDPYSLVHMEPISFTSRDGLTIHGYLSMPLGKKGKVPLVLNVHGGPWCNDDWGFDESAQWLCNRGYAVLQVNYRGSTGYGKDFINAGNKEWGKKMHDDLVDAVSWATKSNIADPDKVAIFGGSYGGYAALAGLTFTPDLFCCAVDIVGPSNLITLINSFPLYWKPLLEKIKRRVGDPETEKEMLMDRSPLTHAHKIIKPLLIGQGANDPRVLQQEAEQIVAALKENNCEYEYMLFEDEGHGFRKHENRMKFFSATERFLAKHLGGRSED
ncbi:S9 family peptidase [bacterium]|nr:S9 family peptidase [bacterium]MBT5015123.1 S9 family peptidase [bacterium]